MTTAPAQLEGEALAAAVAGRVMGWFSDGDIWLKATTVPSGARLYGFASSIADFRPDLNIAQAWDVEATLPDDWDVRNVYIRHLLEQVLGFEVGEDTTPDIGLGMKSFCVKPQSRVFWAVRRATPEQICRAALAAVEAQT